MKTAPSFSSSLRTERLLSFYLTRFSSRIGGLGSRAGDLDENQQRAFIAQVGEQLHLEIVEH